MKLWERLTEAICWFPEDFDKPESEDNRRAECVADPDEIEAIIKELRGMDL